uniref:Albumin domain-containing protein n=1 Tax=Gopherus evgoodei TaxID=1825980 RepID=A0A8C4VWF7_9SAUR
MAGPFSPVSPPPCQGYDPPPSLACRASWLRHLPVLDPLPSVPLALPSCSPHPALDCSSPSSTLPQHSCCCCSASSSLGCFSGLSGSSCYSSAPRAGLLCRLLLGLYLSPHLLPGLLVWPLWLWLLQLPSQGRSLSGLCSGFLGCSSAPSSLACTPALSLAWPHSFVVFNVLSTRGKTVQLQTNKCFFFPQTAIFLDEICHEQGLPEKYGLAACCAKADPERNECFLSHKNSTPGFISPFKRPDPEEACKQYQENRAHFHFRYIYELARRHPFLYSPTILSNAGHYEEMMKGCCKADNKTACFNEKASSVIKSVKESSLVEEQTCEILKKFGERVLKALKLVQVSQKFPKIDFVTATKLATDIAHMHTECCHSDMMDCIHERPNSKSCSDRCTLYSSVTSCWASLTRWNAMACVLQRVTLDYSNGFVYEYSRRHPEFSHLMLLRVGKGYEGLLRNCCKESNPPECYGKGEEILKKQIQEDQELMKTNCDVYKAQGEYHFQNIILVRYTKRMPQLSSKELLHFTKKLAEVGTKCCHLSEDKIFPCAETNVDLILGKICRRHYASSINPNVCKCCSDSYALRRPCITALGIDEKYVPVPLTPDLFTFHEDLCATEEAGLQKKKQELLISLIKYKPTITDEQLKTIITSFLGMREKCCKAENSEACFGEESKSSSLNCVKYSEIFLFPLGSTEVFQS